MERLAGAVVSWLIRHEAIEEDNRELYEYASHCFLLGMAPLVYAVIIGILMGELKASIVLVLPFMFIRKLSGGFHLKNEWACLMSSCLLLYVCLLATIYISYDILFSFIVLLAVFSLIFFSPIDSENRRLEADEKKMRKRETMAISLIFYGVHIVLLFFEQKKYAICIGVGILLTAGLQIPCLIKFLTKNRKKMSFYDKEVEK